MSTREARDLLARVVAVQHRCDLDLLVFFARHPNSLLTSESLAGFLGYELKRIASSLESLLASGYLEKRQTPAHAARLYVFASAHPSGGALPPLLRFAQSREGRLALRNELACDSPTADSDPRAGLQPSSRLPRVGVPQLKLVAAPPPEAEAQDEPQAHEGRGSRRKE